MRATLVFDGTPVELGWVGGKGFALNQLIGMGMPVPSTGSITTFGYRWFVRDSGLQDFIDELRSEGLPDQADLDDVVRRVDQAFLEAPFPDALADEIIELASSVGDGAPLAVRSSATAEDMASASFAGQYRSFLDVNDPENLLRTVKLVWASLWLPAPRTYRAHSGVPEDDLAMSVVVMRLVQARRAGVIFTVNPTGSGSDLRIEAVDGFGDQLVSGEVTPGAHVLPRTSALRRSVDPVLDEAIEVALDLERRFGRPQDVEWAHDGERLYIVQTRPITTTPTRGSDDGFDTDIGPDDAYTTAGIAESLPGVLPPLQWTTAAPLLENGFRRLFDRMRALPPAADGRPFLARVRGRAVLSLDLMKEAAVLVPGGSAEEIERQYFGRVVSEAAEFPETARRGPFKGLRSMLTGFREINARRGFRFEAHVCIDATERLVDQPPDCDLVSTEQLLAYRHRALDLAGRLMAAEISVAAAAAAAYRGVELFLQSHLGDEAMSLAQQLTAGGIDPCGAQVALHTCDLAAFALQDEELAASMVGLAQGDAPALADFQTSLPQARFLAEFEQELGRSGSASVFSGETWAESPDLAWRLMSQAIQVAQSGRRDLIDPGARHVLLDEIESRLATSWKWRMQRVLTAQFIDVRRRLLRRLVADAVEFLHLREKTKSAVLALGGEVRRTHLALGHRLHASGVLEAATDVDLMASQELEPAVRGKSWPSRWEIERRRNVLKILSDDDSLPQVFVGDPSRRLGDSTAPTGDTFTGWGASAGVYEGRARVISAATEPIEPGDVLVARTTDPAWTPLFLTAGAIVVEEGGPLSHAAIIARELGLPAVLNVPGLLDRLASHPSVSLRVDGDEGTVLIRDVEDDADSVKLAEVAG